MIESIVVYTAQGEHYRSIEVKKMEDICFECRYKKHILVFDNSDLEYTPMRFCIDCLKDFHDGKISDSSWVNDVREL